MAFRVLFSLTVLAVLQQAASLGVPGPASGKSKPVAAAWFAGWHATAGYPISSISWDKYNTMIYSFAITTPDVHTLSLEGSQPSLLPQFVEEAHKHNVDAHIAIGGWGGSRYFSSHVATKESRTAFVKTVLDFAKKYKLNGIDFDWEYPNLQGIGCNIINADDTANFLAFLQELRDHPDSSGLALTAAAATTPFRDASGKPSAKVSDFAEVLDYIAIMDYDVWGSWSSGVGPNAPLDDSCASPAHQVGSAVSAIKAWTTAGIPHDKLVLAVPSYGRSYSVSPSDAFVSGSQTELAPYPKFDASKQPLGDKWDNTPSVDSCGVTQRAGGTFRLWGLMDAGFLTKSADPASGIYYRFDECSQTPYVYNKTSQVMISFDNAKTYAAKGKFISENGLRGFSMWEAGADYNNILVNSIRSAAGF